MAFLPADSPPDTMIEWGAIRSPTHATPLSSIPALSSASSSPALSGMARLRQMLASEALPVQPVRPIPDERERHRPTTIETTEDALKGSGRAGLDETVERRARRSESSRRFALDGREGDGPVTPGPVPLTATPSAGFVAQSIHQDAMGSGLHIEPWPAAILAYRRADAGPDGGAMLSRLSV